MTVLITGTNGKTTITHLLKHIFRQAGIPLHSNIDWADDRQERAEAFLEKIKDSRARQEPSLFVLEVDEGDFAYFAEQIKPDWAIISNLSRNQLDRYGELTGLARGIEAGLVASPDCEVILCADDPLVASLGIMADSVRVKDRAFFYGLDNHSDREGTDTRAEHYFIESPHCPFCRSLLKYDGLSFSNFGNFYCPVCYYKRPALDLAFSHLGGDFRETLYSFKFAPSLSDTGKADEVKLRLQLPVLLNAYNAAAAALLARRVGLSAAQIRVGLENCLPPRGRFERFLYNGQEICLMRGENPEAFNADLAWALTRPDFGGLMITLDNPEKKHSGDISWLWDVLFEKMPFAGPVAVSGDRAYDLALRLAYAGVEGERLWIARPDQTGENPRWVWPPNPKYQRDNPLESLLTPPAQTTRPSHDPEQANVPEEHLGNADTQEAQLFRRMCDNARPGTLYWLMDKAAAHRVRPLLKAVADSEIDLLNRAFASRDNYGEDRDIAGLSESFGFRRRMPQGMSFPLPPEAKLTRHDQMGLETLQKEKEERPHTLCLAYLYPDELNLYGDRGNVLCLKARAAARGIDLEVDCISPGDAFDPDRYDLVFMGGGQDSDQDAVYPDFVSKADEIRAAVESGVVFLCICGGYQLMGKTYLTAEGRRIEGLGILDLETEGRGHRMVGDLIFAAKDLALEGRDRLLLGFENHGGETFLGPNARPMGDVLAGYGNNINRDFEGCVYNNLYGTYAHGAFLPRNPKMADHLLRLAWERRHPDTPFPDMDGRLDDGIAELCREARFKAHNL